MSTYNKALCKISVMCVILSGKSEWERRKTRYHQHYNFLGGLIWIRSHIYATRIAASAHVYYANVKRMCTKQIMLQQYLHISYSNKPSKTWLAILSDIKILLKFTAQDLLTQRVSSSLSRKSLLHNNITTQSFYSSFRAMLSSYEVHSA